MKLSKMKRVYNRTQKIRRLRKTHNGRKFIRIIAKTDEKWSKWNGINRKRWLKRLHKRLKVGVVIETCGVDLARVVKVDWEYDDLLYWSLTKPVPEGYKENYTGSCSIYNCGPEVLNSLEAARRLEIFKKEGQDGLSRRYYIEDCGQTPKQAQKTLDDFNKTWRVNNVVLPKS
jgi:hypothetical protein